MMTRIVADKCTDHAKPQSICEVESGEMIISKIWSNGKRAQALKPRPNDRNMPTHHISTLLGQHVECV